MTDEEEAVSLELLQISRNRPQHSDMYSMDSKAGDRLPKASEASTLNLYASTQNALIQMPWISL